MGLIHLWILWGTSGYFEVFIGTLRYFWAKFWVQFFSTQKVQFSIKIKNHKKWSHWPISILDNIFISLLLSIFFRFCKLYFSDTFYLFFRPANVSLLIGVTLFVSRPKTAIGLQTQLPWQFSLPQQTFVTKLILQNVYFVIAICDHLQNILLPSQFLIWDWEEQYDIVKISHAR